MRVKERRRMWGNRGCGLLGVLGALMLAAPDASATPSMSLSFGFEPRVGAYAAQDQELSAYGFAPVASAFLPVWGLRGRLYFASGLFGQLAMSYGLRVAPGDPSPTTISLTETTVGAGYRLPMGLFASLDLGFTAHTLSLGSLSDGGALVYLGPSIHPRVGWAKQLSGPLGSFLAVSLGVNVQFPLGSPHTNPLWEESFARAALPALTLGVESGFGLMGDP